MTDRVQITDPRYAVGETVRVRKAHPIGHCRTPFYFRGAQGVVERHCGRFPNPEELAYGRSGLPVVSLYRVRTRLSELWGNYPGSALDTVEVEVFEHWLEPLSKDDAAAKENNDD